MSRIFISYKRVDKEKVFKIKDQIESALGEKCWIDLDGIESDAVFASKIIGAINNCEVFLFMYSKSHKAITDYENDWTIRELNFAQEKRKRIVFINIDGSELSDWFKLFFGVKQHVDASSNKLLQKLIIELKLWLLKNNADLNVRENIVHATGFENGHEWVDLGLSVKWATCNVGANCPEDYGEYYAWGETCTKSRYDKYNYFDFNLVLGIVGLHWQAYRIGGKTVITPESGYDAARKNWGGNWRMPTNVEFEELIYECNWTWTTLNGHNGYLVKGPNGNCVFFPASGYFYGNNSYNIGKNGYYWSSMLSPTDSDKAYFIDFNGGYHGLGIGDYRCYSQSGFLYRCCGQSVRPVVD